MTPTRVVDLHEDVGHWFARGFDFEGGNAPSTLQKLSRLDDAIVVAMMFPATGRSRYDLTLQTLLTELKYFLRLEREGKVKIVRTRDDLKEKGVKFIIGLEGTDALNDPYDLLWLYEAGLRVIALSWNYGTRFAASCMSKKDYGLTDQGEELVRLANDLGVVIDISHASRQASIEAASISRAPIIASHSNVYSLKPHPRNLDDDVLRALVNTGGVVGVTSIPDTLPEPSVKGMEAVARYIGERFGWEHVAVGTDFLGLDRYPEGFSDISNLSDLSALLGPRSDQVLWENAYRVFSQVLPKG
ncbi:MAG: dipeptidase [Acidilobus sp.]